MSTSNTVMACLQCKLLQVSGEDGNYNDGSEPTPSLALAFRFSDVDG